MPPFDLALSAASGVPRYRQIVDGVTEAVQGGQLAPGSRMPSLRELARELAVSVITVRRAYADLEAAGLLVRVQGQGTFVAEDVRRSARDAARAQARALLVDAVGQAGRLGLSPDEITAAVAAALPEEAK